MGTSKWSVFIALFHFFGVIFILSVLPTLDSEAIRGLIIYTLNIYNIETGIVAILIPDNASWEDLSLNAILLMSALPIISCFMTGKLRLNWPSFNIMVYSCIWVVLAIGAPVAFYKLINFLLMLPSCYIIAPWSFLAAFLCCTVMEEMLSPKMENNKIVVNGSFGAKLLNNHRIIDRLITRIELNNIRIKDSFKKVSSNFEIQVENDSYVRTLERKLEIENYYNKNESYLRTFQEHLFQDYVDLNDEHKRLHKYIKTSVKEKNVYKKIIAKNYKRLKENYWLLRYAKALLEDSSTELFHSGTLNTNLS